MTDKAPDHVQLPQPLWMAGCGNMGGAIVAGWRMAGFDLSGLTVIRPSGTAVEGVRTVSSADEAGPPPAVLVLAMKPAQLDLAVEQLRPHLSATTILVSILAGVELASLRQRFPGVGSVVRAMPNVGVAVRRGVVALVGEAGDEAAKPQAAQLFQPLGFAPWMIDEEKFAAVGSVAGAGPAYVARFIAALSKAGVGRGLDPTVAETLARETVLGTAWLSAVSGEGMDALAKRVASPNGTTEAGLAVLDRDSVLDQLVAVTIDAAARRGAEIAAEARSGAQLAEGSPLP